MNGAALSVEDDGGSLLDLLRDRCGLISVKDGCSPQGQCGCCTVWIDGKPRVSCVTPARRAAGRAVVTLEGVDPARREHWVQAFSDAGASQCGFCTPGILMRLMATANEGRPDEAAIRGALLPHLCRCTGWHSIIEAALRASAPEPASSVRRDPLLASWRALLEGGAMQTVAPGVVEGRGGFASDVAPPGSLIGIRDGSSVSVASDLCGARRALPKVQGRRSGAPLQHPVRIPDGEWALVLQTTWVEPGYLEPDAAWCRRGEEPSSPLANGGAFGAKRHAAVCSEARALAEERGCPVLATWTREEVVRRGPKRPPVAVAVRVDGTGVMRVGRPPGSAALDAFRAVVSAVAPGLSVAETEILGPPVAPELRGAGWAEAAVIVAALRKLREGRRGYGIPVEVVGPTGGRATVTLHPDGIEVDVDAGEVLDEVTLRSYCYGAVHQGLSWVRSEGIAVDEEGCVQDLTIRSFGILSARDTPPITVRVHPSHLVAVNGSDAVFAATATAAWLADDLAPAWPTRRGAR